MKDYLCHKLSLTNWIWFNFRILSYNVKTCDFDWTLSYPTRKRSQSILRNFRALLRSERDCLTLTTIALFEVIVIIAASLACFVVNTESYVSARRPCCKVVR